MCFLFSLYLCIHLLLIFLLLLLGLGLILLFLCLLALGLLLFFCLGILRLSFLLLFLLALLILLHLCLVDRTISKYGIPADMSTWIDIRYPFSPCSAMLLVIANICSFLILGVSGCFLFFILVFVGFF